MVAQEAACSHVRCFAFADDLLHGVGDQQVFLSNGYRCMRSSHLPIHALFLPVFGLLSLAEGALDTVTDMQTPQ